jgi:hypothetical protein
MTMDSVPAWFRALRGLLCGTLATTAFLAGTAHRVDAQTWHWQYTTHPANGQAVAVQSTVVLAGGEISTSYTAPIENRQATIDACRVALADVQRAVVTERSTGSNFLVFQLKPGRSAACQYSGQGSVAALPGEDLAVMRRVADAVNRALPAATTAKRTSARAARATPRAIAQATPKPPSPPPTAAPTATPTAAPTPKPTRAPSPTPAPTATPGVAIAHWVENDGVFTFLRVRNAGRVEVTITDGDVLDCKNVAAGCGALAHRFVLDPFGTATIATLTSSDRALPSFTYRFTATNGRDTLTASGNATTARPSRVARMSSQEIRSAEAAAIGSLRSPAPDSSQNAAFTPPRLIKRGSSRLAIGQTGVAQVRLMIGANGAPEQAEVVSTTNPHLVPAAIETAVSSTYVAATRNGQTVAAKYVATFSFNGEDPATADVPVWRRSPAPAPSAAPTP